MKKYALSILLAVGAAASAFITLSALVTTSPDQVFTTSTPVSTSTPPAASGTITAASCSQADVQAAFNAVTATTTVVSIPAGTCHWTTGAKLTVPAGNENLSVFGAGDLAVAGGGDATVIVDDYASGNPLLSVASGDASSFFRLAGITMQGGSIGSGNAKWNGTFAFGGKSQNFRFDHNHMNFTTYTPLNRGSAIRFTGWVYGVVDHNIIDSAGSSNQIQIWHHQYGGLGSDGDGSWADPTALGTNKFLFIENNTFNNSPGFAAGYADDCDAGGRMVIRYNVLNNEELQTHPTGGAGDIRGCRAWEIYGNTFNGSNANSEYNVFFLSAGTGVIWGNTAPTGYTQFVTIHAMREDGSTYRQQPTPNGWGYCGTSYSGVGSAWDGNVSTTNGYPCLDQPGRGQGNLISGYFPSKINTLTNSIAWPNQALEPFYEWNNIWNNVPGYPNGRLINSFYPNVVMQNRDYYQSAASFDGTSGVGSGTLSGRPSTCTQGVAYWASDTNTLYQCSSLNTWTAFYTPYIYPHPLDQ